MKRFNAGDAARGAVAAHADRPATSIVHDSADARLLVFRLSPGQVVRTHRSASTVTLTVIAGAGVVVGERDGTLVEQACVSGDVVVFAPDEAHGMHAPDKEFLLLATITPRPGGA